MADVESIFDESPDAAGFVPLSVAANRLRRQTQYTSYYIGGIAGYPVCGEGLRFTEEICSHHDIRIHEDDVDEFVRRVQQARG